MKKILLVALTLLLLVGCSNDKKVVDKESGSNVKRVAILQLLTHDALDRSRTGFIDALKDGGYVEGDNLIIDYQNPEADQTNLATMAEAIMNGKPDVILAIATAPTQALQQLQDGTPILATAVTDFVEAKLAESDEHPNMGIAGVSDGCPMKDQLDLLLEFNPEVKTLGILYTSSEENSRIQFNQMKAEAESRGLVVVEKTVPDKTVIEEAMISLSNDGVDAIYIPTDNNIAAAMGSVDVVASEKGIPVLAGEAGMLAQGGLLSIGVDYYAIGYQTGQMAVSLLNGEKTIDDLTVEHQTNPNIYYNSRTAEKIGVTLPESITSRGVDVSAQ